RAPPLQLGCVVDLVHGHRSLGGLDAGPMGIPPDQPLAARQAMAKHGAPADLVQLACLATGAVGFVALAPAAAPVGAPPPSGMAAVAVGGGTVLHHLYIGKRPCADPDPARHRRTGCFCAANFQAQPGRADRLADAV